MPDLARCGCPPHLPASGPRIDNLPADGGSEVETVYYVFLVACRTAGEAHNHSWPFRR